MNDDEQAIRDVIETWMRASKQGDNQTVLSLMANDVVFLIGGSSDDAGQSGICGGTKRNR
jgi:uncharacterized protein (TIGR02246 family)